MNLNLKDKVFIVTGGSKGIGLAIVKSLLQEHAIPVIVTRNMSSLKEIEKEFSKIGVELHYKIAELTDPTACKEAVDYVRNKFNRIDGVINNAGVNDGIGLENGSYEGFMNSIKRNLAHYYLMAHYALPMLKKTKGSIVNIGS